MPELVTPEIVEVPLINSQRPSLYNITDNVFEPASFMVYDVADAVSVYRATTINEYVQRDYLTQGIPWNFELPADGGDGYDNITIKPKEPAELSSIRLVVSDNSRLPREIELSGNYQGVERIIVAREDLSGDTITFPNTKLDFLTLKVYYRQPWRLSNILLSDRLIQTNYAARFLARPGVEYMFYWDQGWSLNVPVGEYPNVDGKAAYGVLGGLMNNETYQTIDKDGDGVRDATRDGQQIDNCLEVPNPDQADINANGIGDSCEDFDRDGVSNYQDNCIDKPNGNQIDTDADGVGDICDSEESRLTEKYKWLPWAGMAIAGLVLFTLFIIAAKHEFDQRK